MSVRSILEDVSLTSKRLLLREPFYGLFIIGMNKEVNNDIPTAGVSRQNINVQLSINEKFWESLERNHRLGVMKHEILHVAFNHIVTRDDYADKELFNIAADLEINQYIDRNNLPSFGLFLENFGLENYPKRGTKFYYDYLKKDLDNPDPNCNPNLKAMHGAMKAGKKTICSHETWQDFSDLSEAEKKMIKSQVEHQAKLVANAVKSQGSMPSELAGWIDGLFTKTPPVIDWRKLFRRFVGGSKEVFTKKTRRKQSKRIAGNPGLKIKTKPRAIIYWDQSGSVSAAEHKMFFNEVKHMYKAGLNFDIAPFNTRVFEPYKYKGENKYQSAGGGTSFTPIAEHFNKVSRHYSFGVILTDGEAEMPPKFNKPMLWVVTPQGVNPENSMEGWPGTKIKMNKDAVNNQGT